MEEDIKKCQEFINLSFLYGKLSFTKTQLYEYQKAIATLLNRLEQLEKENKKKSIEIICYQEEYIPKSVIREKIEELNEYYKKEVYPTKEEWADIDIIEFYDNQIELLKELLGDEQ